MSVKVVKDDLPAVLKAIEAMGRNRVLVGIPQAEDGRTDSIGNAQLGYIHENGSPANNIPARPFLKPGVASCLPAATDVLKQAAKDAFKSPGAIDQGLNRVGLLAQSAVKKYMRDSGHFVPLMEATIKARQRKGHKGTKPLIRTGQLLNSISYVIRKA